MTKHELGKATLCILHLLFHLVSLLCPSCWIAVRPQCEWIASPRIASYPTDETVDIFPIQLRRAIPGLWKIRVFVNYLKQLSCALCHLTVRQRIDHLGKKKRFLETIKVHLCGWSHNPEEQLARLSSHLHNVFSTVSIHLN